MENMYWDMRGSIFKFLNKFQKEASLLQPIMIRTIFFCIRNIFLLCGEMPQKGKPQLITELKVEWYTVFNVSRDM